MPFVRKTDSQGSQPQTDTRKLFIGRADELHFFVQKILKPEEPTHNIISIWGQGGVGKSTLISRFIDEAHSVNFQDYLLTALVDERQTTSMSMMEKFANQLHIDGEFGKALKHYKEALRTQQTDREMMQDTLVQRIPTFAGAAVEGVPFVGPLLGEGVKATGEHLIDRRNNIQRHIDAVLLEDPVNALTRAFVDELNHLAETQVLVGSRRYKKRRVILFFDTFEQLAIEAAPWLLDNFLPADIDGNIVLVIAGRDPIERSMPGDTKRWLPYSDNRDIYWIPLNSFTEDETRAYLTKRNITDPERIATIWQLSQGLPLYLSLLTSNPRGKVDPTADVVANFLRWIPKEEQTKRQLALDAALFSRPFTQDDLAAFPYLPKNELPSLYYWLISQPFLIPQEDGRYRYHDLARDLFSQHLYRQSKKQYYNIRKALADYYQRFIEEIRLEDNIWTFSSTEWIELLEALIHQLFLLTNTTYHVKAIENILKAYRFIRQRDEIIRILCEIYQEISIISIDAHSRELVKCLILYTESEPKNQELLAAINYILEQVVHIPTFPAVCLAPIYANRGRVYSYLKDYRRAIIDLDRAIELDANLARAYQLRGRVYSYLKNYQSAIADFDRTFDLDPENDRAYLSRGYNYLWLRDINKASADFMRSWQLDSTIVNYGWMIEWVNMCREQPDLGIARQLEAIAIVNPDNFAAYICRGVALMIRESFEGAVAEINRAILLKPESEDAYFWFGFVHIFLGKDIEAIAAIEKSLELVLPPILLTPLRWFEQDRPDFYQQYVVPLLARYDLV